MPGDIPINCNLVNGMSNQHQSAMHSCNQLRLSRTSNTWHGNLTLSQVPHSIWAATLWPRSLASNIDTDTGAGHILYIYIHIIIIMVLQCKAPNSTQTHLPMHKLDQRKHDYGHQALSFPGPDHVALLV